MACCESNLYPLLFLSKDPVMNLLCVQDDVLGLYGKVFIAEESCRGGFCKKISGAAPMSDTDRFNHFQDGPTAG